MDGGGRFPESLSGDAAGRSGPARFAGAVMGRLPSRSLSVRRARSGQRLGARLSRGTGTVAVSMTFAAFALAGFVASGRYDSFVIEQGRPLDIAARVLGFGVERVTISGISRMYEREVLAAAGIDWRSSVPFLDVGAVREKLLRVPLIAQASVRKIYPNEIAITQVEREPAALWQSDGLINVISTDGKVIDKLTDERYLGLPLIVGNTDGEDAEAVPDKFPVDERRNWLGMFFGASSKVEKTPSQMKEERQDRFRERMLREYLTLREAAGSLSTRIQAGTYVSGRRWTLKIGSIDVRLPENDPQTAMRRLVKLEMEDRLLEKDIIAVDMRMLDRVVIRLSEEAATARVETQKAKKKATSL